ncbi:hypothetical protein [Clostridium perfringens]|uniref:hypothetical protein n=1 Tax=Clostridium perfringens TaxID=1502 RepID=UPI000A909EC8|nr:hypothetical protein [Clostridium perfringens]EJT6340609.1 hypothetical protein [Clostridium perfringens]
MAIKDTKTRFMVTTLKKNKEKLDYLCEKEKRTTSSQIEMILEDYFERNNIKLPDEE